MDNLIIFCIYLLIYKLGNNSVFLLGLLWKELYSVLEQHLAQGKQNKYYFSLFQICKTFSIWICSLKI